MRPSELKPDTLYASCDGAMVVPVEPISAKWYAVPARDEDGNLKYDQNNRNIREYVVLDEKPKEDPWATCSTSRRPAHWLQGPATLVEVFAFDADGKQLASRGKMLMKAKDIGGTWDDYLLLHSEKVRSVAEEEAFVKELPALRTKLAARLSKTGFQFPVGEVRRRSEGDIHFYPGNDSSKMSSHLNVTEKYVRDRKVLEGPPVEFHSIGVTIMAKNEADVEYLLEVLRHGVTHMKSLEKRRAREARTRTPRSPRGPRKLKKSRET